MLAVDRAFGRADAILRGACGKEFTAAVARIQQGENVLFERAYGSTRDDELGRPVFVDTYFDLASITKPFVATILLQNVAAGRLRLDDSLTRIFPGWRGTAHERITPRMLLAHNSGMNSGADYRELLDRDIVQFALERELVAPPGERVIYSDLGFIVVGELLQRMTGCSLSAQMRAFSPATIYLPRAPLQLAIPATEDDGWRGRVQGFVHDEKAFLMGGVAGHAGLFGTAAAVAWLAEQYLGALRGRSSVLPGELAREAVTEQAYDPVLRRGLGWALKTTDENSCGRFLSSESFGHTGFVGTCVWADPVRDCSGVLLTNAVYFGRSDIRDLRAAFYEAMVDGMEAA